jgi:acetyl-CoA synthetase
MNKDKSDNSPGIETVLKEHRHFAPSEGFRTQALIKDPHAFEALRLQAEKEPEKFWGAAADTIDWFQRWTQVLEWNPPFCKWFLGATTNAAYNCLDRHLPTKKDKTALLWEGEDGTVVKLTYQELHHQVCQLANALERDLGMKTGDTAAIYLPLTPQAIIAMLACARIGVTHSVIFAGFASPAIRDRVQDAECKIIFTSDVGFRRGQVLELKKMVDTAIVETPCVEKVIVLRRRPETVLGPRDIDWDQLLKKQSSQHQAKALDAEHPLFFLYTSGTTGKPKGIVHSTGGYLVGVNLTAKWIFDLKDDDIYWCTADVGWVTGHSYLVYGILGNGATALLYEGALNYPHPNRIWELVDKHHATILYTAPTAIRSFMRAGTKPLDTYRLTSLRLLGSVGEPINPEAWMWYHTAIGRGQCPIVDTWWQTETGSILISPIPGVTELKPGSATKAFPGISADIVDEEGKSCGPNQGGYLVIRKPWPSMMRTIHKDPKRFEEQYFSRFKGIYLTGDGAHRDEDGYFWIKGRVDDVINVSGHRLGTMEIESALVSHPDVAEAAVVGRADERKGQAIVAFVIPKESAQLSDIKRLTDQLKNHVVQEIGAIARPDEIRLTRSLPKTRSGKIMRRLLKELASGKEVLGDTTTLENPGLVDIIK